MILRYLTLRVGSGFNPKLLGPELAVVNWVLGEALAAWES